MCGGRALNRASAGPAGHRTLTVSFLGCPSADACQRGPLAAVTLPRCVVGFEAGDKKKPVVQGRGNGSVDEILAVLRDDAVQFGGFRVFAVDGRDGGEIKRPKLVSFVWTGPSVGIMTKVQAASSKNAIMKYFLGSHIGLHVFERHELSEDVVSVKLLASGGAHKPIRFDFGDGSSSSGVPAAEPPAGGSGGDATAEPAAAAEAPAAAAAPAPAKPAPAAPAAAPVDGTASGETHDAATEPAEGGSADVEEVEVEVAEVAAPKPEPVRSRRASQASSTGLGGAGGAGGDDGDGGKKKRRAVVFAEDADDPDATRVDSAEARAMDASEAADKNEAALAAISKAMEHYLFAGLDESQSQAVIDEFRLCELVAGSEITTQGSKGDQVYVLESGTVQVLVDGKEVMSTSDGGTLFGELALLYDAPRAASVITVTPARIWVLKASRFRKVMISGSKKALRERVRWLSKVPILSELSVPDLAKAADLMEEKSYSSEDLIIRQGDHGDAFYVIKKGTVVCRIEDGGDGTDVAELSEGQFFGEMALLKDTPRTCHVLVKKDCEEVQCLVLPRKGFEDLLGPLQEVLDNIALKRQEELDAVKVDVPGADADGKAEEAGAAAAATVDDGVPAVYSEEGGRTIPFDVSSCETLGLLGEGSFGVVKMVRHNGEVLALKRLWKQEIVTARQTQHVMRERRLLSALDSDCIVRLKGTATDEHSLFMLLELIQGGELWSLLYNEKSPLTGGSGGMSEEHARFYAFSITEGLHILYKNDVAYRDLKPENLMVGANGYLKMIDFGFAKSIPYKKGGEVCAKSYTMLGSPDYLPPEVIMHKGHDKSVDLWALGCVIYELIVGKTPFADENQNKTFERACQADLNFPDGIEEQYPLGVDLIRKLIVVDPVARLGAQRRGVQDVLDHEWFATIDKEAFFKRELPAPHIPEVSDPEDRSNFELGDEEYDSEDEEKVWYEEDTDYFKEF